MAAELLFPVFVAVSIGLCISLVLEQCLLPRPALPWQRRLSTVVLHAGVWIALCGFTLLVWRRPVFLVFNALAIQSVIVGVSVVKFRALREPFIYADFEYFLDVLRHPRLYLPFFGVWLALLCVLGYGGIVGLGLYLEQDLFVSAGHHVLTLAATMMAGGCVMAWLAGKRTLPITLRAGADLQKFGLVAALWHYAVAEKQADKDFSDVSPFFAPAAVVPTHELPDLVVIQSESFFDVRRQYPQVNPAVLSGFDRLRKESILSGRLGVAAWGANTVRTEFGFLSGLSDALLGIHQYNPYRTLVRQGFPSIASWLKSLGYRTVCIHPYSASFYARDRVYPQLGFDAFIDIRSFEGADYAGQYVSDMAVADKIHDMLGEERDVPLFLFAITMENHGPLHWDRPDASDHDKWLREPLDARHDDLVSYTRHIANADQMFISVARTLQEQQRPGALCIYGDHVPIMEQVYQDLGTPDGRTDYLCWTTTHRGAGQACDLTVDQLAGSFLSVAGVTGHAAAEQMSA